MQTPTKKASRDFLLCALGGQITQLILSFDGNVCPALNKKKKRKQDTTRLVDVKNKFNFLE